MGKAFPKVKFSLVFTSKESLRLAMCLVKTMTKVAEAVYGLSSYVPF